MADLRKWQEAVARICLSPSPDATDFEAAGGYADRWALYRTMVRGRFRRVLREGAPRTARVLGRDAMDALSDAYLATSPPRARFLRDLVGEFAEWCHARGGLQPAPMDALRYDVAVIHARDAREPDSPVPESFAFELPPMLSVSVRLLTLIHAVHRGDDEACEPTTLLVYRHAQSHDPRWLALQPLEAAIVSRWLDGSGTAAERAIAAANALGAPVDAAFAEQLGDLAARLLERGALRGSRPVSTAAVEES